MESRPKLINYDDTVTPIEVACSDEMQSYGVKTQSISFSNFSPPPPPATLKIRNFISFLLCLLETLSSANWFQVPQFKHNCVTGPWCDIPLYFFNWNESTYPLRRHKFTYSNKQSFLSTCSGFFFMISWPLKLEPIGCPETSVRNYHYTLLNDPEGRSSHLLRGGSLKLPRLRPTIIKI